MTDFSDDREAVEAISIEVRKELDTLMLGADRISEFTVGTGYLQARRPLTPVQRELAVVLNTLSDLLGRRAQEARLAKEPRWQGLADAGTTISNETGRLGLPQLFRELRDAEDADE